MTVAVVSARATARRWWLDWHVGSILLVALALRIGVWWLLPYRGYISDEAEYVAAATWLADGRGFSFFQGWIWTRPPLYVMFVAAHIKLFGPETLWPLRFSQALLSTISVWLVMQLGSRLAPPDRMRQVALTSGWTMAIAYSFATFGFLALSETVFITLLLAALLALIVWAQRGGTRWLILGGVLLGLGALTRAVLTGVLPFVAAWVCWQGVQGRIGQRVLHGVAQRRLRRSGWSRGLIASALLTVVVSAVILPWSVYTSRYFGGPILIDTTGGYNAMLGAQAAHQEIDPAPECLPERPPRCEEAIFNTLIAISNHAQRQQAANSYALQWIGENPDGFVRKASAELIDLLTVNYGGAERLRNGYTLGAVPAPHLLGLLLDDTLYVVAAPLAVLGLLRRQCRSGKGLVVAWLLFNLLTGPLFFAINRFRQPLLPFIFVYAACAVWQWRLEWPSQRRHVIGIGLASVLALVLLPSFVYWPPQWNSSRRAVVYDTWLGLRGRIDARRCDTIERLIDVGHLEAAQRLHDAENVRRASDVGSPDRRNCLALLNARMLQLRGQPEAALALLQSMRELPERYLMEGSIYQAQGQLHRARGAFVAGPLERANPTAWAWMHLSPPPTQRIDLGSGFDWGYLDQFYTREGRAEDPGNYRWTSPGAKLRFVGAGTGQPQTLRLRVGRPALYPPAPLSISLVNDQLDVQTISNGWQEMSVPVPASPAGSDVIVTLDAPALLPDPRELQQRQQVGQQLRLLGVQVDWAELVDRTP